MPNGGSDCCGTCWFNNANDGQAGMARQPNTKDVVCTIRNLEIPQPFWTYCINHPHHNYEKIDVPIGPVYINDGYPYSRKLWMQPPDTPEVREKLLGLLDKIDEQTAKVYPLPMNFDHEIIKQLQFFKEMRAIESLLRIAQYDMSLHEVKLPPMVENKPVIVGQAIEALLEISNGDYLDKVSMYIQLGVHDDYNKDKDGYAPIRYHLVRGLKYCPQPEAEKLLRLALQDPHSEVKAFAQEILDQKYR